VGARARPGGGGRLLLRRERGCAVRDPPSTPHNALFDFEASVEGAERIDEIARAAQTARDEGAGREVVGHTDWAVRHVRFDVDSLWPSPEESLAFLADYEDARGAPFTANERRSAHGAAVYLGAYAARCTWAYARVANREPLEALANALL
jgi:hypothetical protein